MTIVILGSSSPNVHSGLLDMASILLLCFAFFAHGVMADPQGGSSTPDPSSSDELAATAEWRKKIVELVALVRTNLISIENIAMEDNPVVGRTIAATLQREIIKAGAIYIDYTLDSARDAKEAREFRIGLRVKRDANSAGAGAFNAVADVLVNSGDKIKSENKQLSPKAQKSISKKRKEGLEKCGADACKAAAKLLAAADDAADERQR